MTLHIIAAMAANRALGKNNQLLWHIPADLKHFKATTLGHPIVMGRKTFASIGRLLPGRENIILTRDEQYNQQGATIIHDPQVILDRSANETLFIIGGGELYRHFLPHAKTLHLTFVDQQFDGDVFFPEVDMYKDFKIISESPKTRCEKSGLEYRFVTAERVSE